QILERRARLQAASTSMSSEYVEELLAEVDAALARIERGTYGLCETCHDPIEEDRLQANPLVRFCLDHLNATERAAHEQDLELATQIQSKLLPPACLTFGTWNTDFHYEPAGPVGGDYCEVEVLEDGQSLFFAVGDVAGKGVAASLLMTHLSAILRSLLSLRLPLAELMARANRLFCENTLTAHYATLVCGRATPNEVDLCNAGHCPPLLLGSESVNPVGVAGLPLGLFCGVEYPVTRVPVSAGESLVLYTDGVTEAHDPDGSEFGDSGLRRSLVRARGQDAAALRQAVVQDVAAFRRGARPSDDLTLLVLRRRE
ncbi:MAG TPA: SpoIIE family protein phosphatase, partial [Bryobacteraceae bacterium]|nr:SpoIIE family protein phosphatase [Bryobacteraceae bacterium]